MIVIINYGMGNLHSVYTQCKRVGFELIISSKQSDIENADKLILPGVGHFSKGMEKLKELNLIEVLSKKVIQQETPILGICLGMQLLSKKSEEGNVTGLGWIDAETVQFDFAGNSNPHLHTPHIGWNSIDTTLDNLLFEGMKDNPSFYFVHSYYVKCNSKEDIAATTEYGNSFVSAIAKNNIFATQFHPEKSHDYGLALLKNFMFRPPHSSLRLLLFHLLML